SARASPARTLRRTPSSLPSSAARLTIIAPRNLFQAGDRAAGAFLRRRRDRLREQAAVGGDPPVRGVRRARRRARERGERAPGGPRAQQLGERLAAGGAPAVVVAHVEGREPLLGRQ